MKKFVLSGIAVSFATALAATTAWADITIATVDFEGRVTGRGEGTATIFAKSAPGPVTVCQQTGVICDSVAISVDEPDPGPGPEP